MSYSLIVLGHGQLRIFRLYQSSIYHFVFSGYINHQSITSDFPVISIINDFVFSGYINHQSITSDFPVLSIINLSLRIFRLYQSSIYHFVFAGYIILQSIKWYLRGTSRNEGLGASHAKSNYTNAMPLEYWHRTYTFMLLKLHSVIKWQYLYRLIHLHEKFTNGNFRRY